MLCLFPNTQPVETLEREEEELYKEITWAGCKHTTSSSLALKLIGPGHKYFAVTGSATPTKLLRCSGGFGLQAIMARTDQKYNAGIC